MSEVEDAEPPRARLAVITSPSRVTTVSDGFARRTLSASRALSTTTVDERREISSSEISLDRTCAVSGVSPAGIDAADDDPAS